ncbi:MAG: hypothetical protein COB22_00010 [Cycloclasticus sp.]|nr:MAG: hypothetical protein COB22_00010 [Cycloclasticus sp.]
MTKKQLTFALSIRDDISDANLFSNGISQNIIFLCDLFELLGHKVILLVNTKRQQKKVSFRSKQNYKIFTVDELVEKNIQLDIAFEIGQILGIKQRNSLAKLGAKMVTVHCGNQLIMDMEILFYGDGKDTGRRHISDITNHVWIIPQHAHQLTYMEVLTEAEVNICPCIWEPSFLPLKHKSSMKFRRTPNIYVMEPNMSVVKNALIPITIIEALHRESPDIFNKAYIVNGMRIHKHPYFLNNIASNFHSTNAKLTPDKVYFTPRAPFHDAFTHYDVLLSHHWRNELNYLSFEALYYNIPMVHNSVAMKSVGFFYPDFDARLGKEALRSALTEHKSNFKEHEQLNKQFLKTISIHNPTVQEKYKQLIDKALSS